jgi:hypothetical protein
MSARWRKNPIVPASVKKDRLTAVLFIGGGGSGGFEKSSRHKVLRNKIIFALLIFSAIVMHICA